MPNVLWGYRDREFFEPIASATLLKTVEGFPVGSTFNTSGFGIVTAEVKKKLTEILAGRHGDVLIKTLEREFKRAEVLKILHALYLGLYTGNLLPIDISESISRDSSSHGITLERVFAHSLSQLDRFTPFKTPLKIDWGGKDGPGIDIVFGDNESNIIWGVVMTAQRKKATGSFHAQREVNMGIFSDIWYKNTTGSRVNKHPLIYTPNRIISIRLRGFDYSPDIWKRSFETWRAGGYSGNMYDNLDGPEGQFLHDFFINFPTIMDSINQYMHCDTQSLVAGELDAYSIGDKEITLSKSPEGIILEYTPAKLDIQVDERKPLKISLHIPHAHLGIPVELIGNSLNRDMYYAGWLRKTA